MLRKIIAINLFLIFAASYGFAQNYKIRQSTTINGQKIESTVYVKNSRKRTESGGFMGMGKDVADIEQCDMKRNIKVNDQKKLYFIELFADSTETTTATTNNSASNSKTKKGGTVTVTSNITDTGERKQMFGLTARHIKTTMTMQASADACTDADMMVETDGWYVDLPQFSCPMQMPQNPMMANNGGNSGCRDKMILKQSGSGKLGFALMLTTKMKMGDDDEESMTQTLETLEFSKATLDDALFDIPAGYNLAKSSQDLYGKPNMSMIQNNQNTQTTVKNNQVSTAKKAGMIRVGVIFPTSKSGNENVSLTNLQGFLVQKLTSGNVEAVAVSSEEDARSRNCDYVLTSDFTKLKESTVSKVGGMFGKVINKDTSAGRNYDVQIDFKLVLLTSGKAFSNKVSKKTEADIDRAAEAALVLEAEEVLKTVKQ